MGTFTSNLQELLDKLKGAPAQIKTPFLSKTPSQIIAEESDVGGTTTFDPTVPSIDKYPEDFPDSVVTNNILKNLPQTPKSNADSVVFDEDIQKKINAIKSTNAIADAKAKAEAKAAYDDSAKGRFEKFYNDDGKRNAVLNAISDTMLQTKYGKDVYGNRMNELPGNINRALAQNEALDMAKTQAALDMQQTAAETSKLNNPLEWLSDKQKQARDIATAMGAEQGYEFGSPEWKEAYARELRQIAAPSLMSGSIDGIVGIKDLLIKYGSTLDQETMDVMNGLVDVLQAQLPGNAGAPSQSYNTIKAKVKE
jgi:hypothetical protein|tara:strand:+ start:893 stop:1822 length:930 start_codon:yes stop_codon:yes gene_type:complete